jgi:hypothetical protein
LAQRRPGDKGVGNLKCRKDLEFNNADAGIIPVLLTAGFDSRDVIG